MNIVGYMLRVNWRWLNLYEEICIDVPCKFNIGDTVRVTEEAIVCDIWEHGLTREMILFHKKRAVGRVVRVTERNDKYVIGVRYDNSTHSYSYAEHELESAPAIPPDPRTTRTERMYWYGLDA